MASLPDHLHQAWHNQELAEKLTTRQGLEFRDWLITIAFYAAVHYVEAFFTTVTAIGHTDTACPDNEREHKFRRRKVKEQLGPEPWKSYSKLMNASYHVRYLPISLGRVGIGSAYYRPDDAKRFFERDLRVVRDAVGQHIRVTQDGD
jgi:hypothetical protein